MFYHVIMPQMAVEKMEGISRLEQFVEEERVKELKQEKKRQKKKNRRKNKCGYEISDQEADNKEKTPNEVIVETQNFNSKSLFRLLLEIAVILVIWLRDLLSLWRAVVKGVGVMMRMKMAVKRESLPMKTYRAGAQVTLNKVKNKTL